MTNQGAAHGVHFVCISLGNEKCCTDVNVQCKLCTIIGRFMIVVTHEVWKCGSVISD